MTEFERSLAALSPSRGAFDRDRLMFEAGRGSAPAPSRLRWAWAGVAAALAVVALGRTFVPPRRPEPRVVERLVFVQPSPTAPDESAEPGLVLRRNTISPGLPSDDPDSVNPYLSWRRQIERHGLEGLPNPEPFLTFSEGAGSSELPMDEPRPLSPYDLGEFLDTGGPS